jgi:transcription-repair coupling factor (superfamily II helicase)
MNDSHLASEKTLLNSPVSPVLPDGSGHKLLWSRLYGSSRGLAIAEAARRHIGPLLVVARNAQSLQRLGDEIRFYGKQEACPVLEFPDWECLPYDAFSPHPDIVSQRLATLAALPGLEKAVVLVAAATLMHRLAPRAYIASQTLRLDAGQTLDVERFRGELVNAAYRHVSQVMEPGEFAVRGGLIDLYPVGSPTPYRLDLFGDQLESIRAFDPATQRSGEKFERLRLLPAREFPLTEDGITRFRAAFRARFEGDPQKTALYRDVSKGLAPAGIEYYLPLFFEGLATFGDYLPDRTLVVLDSGVEESIRRFEREAEERYAVLRHDRERPRLPPGELFLGAASLFEELTRRPHVELVDLSAEEDTAADHLIRYDAPPPPALPVDPKSEAPYHRLFEQLRATSARTLIVAETAGRRETLRTLLTENSLSPADVADWSAFLQSKDRLAITLGALEKGLTLSDPPVMVITESQLYGERAAQRRRRTALGRDPETILKNLAELKVGDAVVHEEHGIGRYLGLQILDVGDGPTEFLTIEYAGGDKLYVPVLSLHLIGRYTGTDPEHAPLHRLGGDAWEKARRRAMEKAHDAAAEILAVQALRAARQGRAFPRHDAHYQVFADAFPFEETPDQAKAIEDVLADMETAKSMDRLVCGDVGFGKTEVAIRAAFLAVHGGAQVAVLVPTTLLAAQHFETFRDRFAGTHRDGRAVHIELLSRFRTKGEETKVLERLARGEVDIVVGTHRLLQPDVRFANLGLAILDEEHRFGVRQKERLKQLRAEVDVLTLTATPIPRTLNMAFAGLRDISIIAQAPEGRLSIKTFISEWDRGLIREAILREIRRGGQVYYLHNEVRTIERAAQQLQELVPEAEIRIGHGQMPERELERIMLDFYHQRFNVLVCSTIVESGIDVPTANTIIIERADKFGLAQLHQLRGRVGRSRHRAYAYLLIPGWSAVTGDVRKRLEAIASLEDLGAGFALASHDLEIRGAGELLGEAQSGVIDEVGFSLYAEMLERAVRSLRAGKIPDTDLAAPGGTEVNLHAPTLLPADYLPDVHLRLILYKRIAQAADGARLQELEEELVDRFGRLPPAAKLLFQATALKLKALPFGIRKIEAGPKGARIEFAEKPNVDPGAILRLMQSAPRLYRLDGPNRVRLLAEMPEPEIRIKAVAAFLDGLRPATAAAAP